METIWLTPTTDDLNRVLVAAQAAALRTAALAVGQSDPFVGARDAVVAEVRAAIQSCARNLVSATAGTVPPELVSATMYLILAEMQGRLPSLRMTEDQKELVSQARKRLERIAECKLAVSAPSEALEPASVQRGGGASVVEADTSVRTATRTQMDGL